MDPVPGNRAKLRCAWLATAVLALLLFDPPSNARAQAFPPYSRDQALRELEQVRGSAARAQESQRLAAGTYVQAMAEADAREAQASFRITLACVGVVAIVTGLSAVAGFYVRHSSASTLRRTTAADPWIPAQISRTGDCSGESETS